jgi:hypothetical protein
MTTEILKLTEVLSTDADKFTIHNTALREIESRLIRVKSKTNGGPPASPASGDTYIVDVASGAWASFTVGNIAHYYGGAWTQALPLEGWREWVNDADREHIYNGTNWNTYNINSGPATSATSISIIDNTANAFAINEGANQYFGITTTNGSETVNIAANSTPVSIQGVTTHTENVSVTKSTNGAIKFDVINVNTGVAANAQIRFSNDNSNFASMNLTGVNYTGVASWQDSWVWYMDSGLSGGLKLSIDTGGVKISTSGLETSDFVVDDSGNVTVGVGKLRLVDGSAAAPSSSFTNDIDTGIYSSAANSIGFSCGGSLKAELNSSGQLSIPSGSIVLNGGDALTTYDEGIWTPSIVDSSFSGSEGVTYSAQVGTYTRIGDEVHIQGQIIVTSLGTLTAGDPVYLAGLPFAAENVSSSRSGISVHAASGLNITAGHSIEGRILENTSYADLQVWDSTAGTTSMLVSELSATGDIVFSGNYKV